jgi:hypothetical protein
MGTLPWDILKIGTLNSCWVGIRNLVMDGDFSARSLHSWAKVSAATTRWVINSAIFVKSRALENITESLLIAQDCRDTRWKTREFFKTT